MRRVPMISAVVLAMSLALFALTALSPEDSYIGPGEASAHQTGYCGIGWTYGDTGGWEYDQYAGSRWVPANDGSWVLLNLYNHYYWSPERGWVYWYSTWGACGLW